MQTIQLGAIYQLDRATTPGVYMKNFVLGISLGAFLIGTPLFAEAPITQMNDINAQGTAQDIANFRQQMTDELNKQQKYIDQLAAGVMDTSISPMFINKVELGNALIQLDVKKTLVANFWNSTTLASPVLRSVLLQILKKDLITEGDLAYLQTVADTEKAKLQQTQAAPASSAPAYAPPTPATAPTQVNQSTTAPTNTIPLPQNPQTPIPPVAPDTTLPSNPSDRVVY